ncbi:MAG TPA: lipoyl(octanoyl) transferase LipB [Edaphocola sp.]|nr:lipoyl(octanoyl) transferase LipB [Edaphocola sp.]
MPKIIVRDLGNIEYGTAWDLQEKILREGLTIKSERHSNPNSPIALKEIQQYLLLVEHPHVYTLGKSGHQENLLIDKEKMESLGISFYPTNRGGDITYHGPGQMVAYPILDLETLKSDLGWYMSTLEEAIINTIAFYGLKGARLKGSTGVWIDADDPAKARKICAMGVKCSRWLTIHGLALNVNTNLDFFNFIVPCGITDKGVTSIAKEIGHEVDENEVKQEFIKQFSKAFQVVLISENEYKKCNS